MKCQILKINDIFYVEINDKYLYLFSIRNFGYTYYLKDDIGDASSFDSEEEANKFLQDYLEKVINNKDKE